MIYIYILKHGPLIQDMIYRYILQYTDWIYDMIHLNGSRKLSTCQRFVRTKVESCIRIWIHVTADFRFGPRNMTANVLGAIKWNQRSHMSKFLCITQLWYKRMFHNYSASAIKTSSNIDLWYMIWYICISSNMDLWHMIWYIDISSNIDCCYMIWYIYIPLI